MVKERNSYRILVGKPEGKRPIGRPQHKWVDNIKIDLREIGWDGMDWIDLVQNRDHWGGLCEHGNESSGSLICWEFLEWLHNWQPFKNIAAP
jgi:hypothetical protein